MLHHDVQRRGCFSSGAKRRAARLRDPWVVSGCVRVPLQRTLRGIASQLDDLDPEVAWEEFVCVIMVDGREKMHATVAELVQNDMKLYDPKLLKDQMEGMVRAATREPGPPALCASPTVVSDVLERPCAPVA